MFRIDEIAKQHKELFPRAEKYGQVNKLTEELIEYLCADTVEQKEKELADCLIVCAGVYRFDNVLGMNLAKNIYEIIEKLKFSQSNIEKEVLQKWQINKRRRWKYRNQQYHHIGVDGEE